MNMKTYVLTYILAVIEFFALYFLISRAARRYVDSRFKAGFEAAKSEADQSDTWRPSPKHLSTGLSLWHALKRDPVARVIISPLLSRLIGIWTVIFICLLIIITPQPLGRNLSIIIACISIPLVSLLVVKIIFYHRLFTEGEQIAGKVTRLSLNNDPADLPELNTDTGIKCWIEYSYSFHDRTYYGKGVLNGKNEHEIENFRYKNLMDCELLRPGDEISLIVDPAKPERSILRDPFAAGADTLLHIGMEEKAQREAFAAFEPPKPEGPALRAVYWLVFGLFFSALPVIFFYMYFTYEPLTGEKLRADTREVAVRVREWWSGNELRMQTYEYACDFKVSAGSFKYFDFVPFKKAVRAGDEMGFSISKEDFKRIGTRGDTVYVETASSKKDVYLSIESALAADKDNHKMALYFALGSSLLGIVGIIALIRAPIEYKKKKAKRKEKEESQ